VFHFTLLKPFPAHELALTVLLASSNRGQEWKVISEIGIVMSIDRDGFRGLEK
jgi:hypothetical protein